MAWLTGQQLNMTENEVCGDLLRESVVPEFGRVTLAQVIPVPHAHPQGRSDTKFAPVIHLICKLIFLEEVTYSAAVNQVHFPQIRFLGFKRKN